MSYLEDGERISCIIPAQVGWRVVLVYGNPEILRPTKKDFDVVETPVICWAVVRKKWEDHIVPAIQNFSAGRITIDLVTDIEDNSTADDIYVGSLLAPGEVLAIPDRDAMLSEIAVSIRQELEKSEKTYGVPSKKAKVKK
jgi:hypothetical protein